MPAVCRETDTSTHGGAVVSGSPTLSSDGLPVARIGDLFACPIHGLRTIVSGSTREFADGIGIARIGDPISCGASLSSGSLKKFSD
jgi:uncharacterized Zn-binding protein involved in type VI secretion